MEWRIGGSLLAHEVGQRLLAPGAERGGGGDERAIGAARLLRQAFQQPVEDARGVALDRKFGGVILVEDRRIAIHADEARGEWDLPGERGVLAEAGADRETE